MEITFDVIDNQKEDQNKKKEKIADKLGRTYATGKRKTAIARVWIKKGKGEIKINSQDQKKYFPEGNAFDIISSPFYITQTEGKFDVFATVKGGGVTGQADALKHGISKALSSLDFELYGKILKTNGFLTRDSRIVERKKYGQKKARKNFQFSKR